MTAAIATTALHFPSEQAAMGAEDVNAIPAAYLKQRTTRRRRVLPNIDCIQLEQPTVWDVSMPSEFGGSTDSDSDAGVRQTPQKPKKPKKAIKFVNKTTNSWVSTNTTTTVVLPGAMVQFVGPLGPVRGAMPRAARGLGESPYEDVDVTARPQAYLEYAPPPPPASGPAGAHARAVPRMAPPSTGMAPPAGAHAFNYMDAYGTGAAARHAPAAAGAAAVSPYEGGSSRVEVLEEESVVAPPAQARAAAPAAARALATPNGSETRRSSLPVIRRSADRQSSAGVPSTHGRPASYDGADRRPLYRPPAPRLHESASYNGGSVPNSVHGAQPGARLHGSQPALPQHNNFMSPPSDRVMIASISQRTQDEVSSSLHHATSDSSRRPRSGPVPTAAASAPQPARQNGDAALLAGPRYYVELDRKSGYAQDKAEGGTGVEDLMFADEL